MGKTVTLPSVKWGKRKDRSQMCEVFTVDGRWKDVELPALINCVDDGQRGFLLDPANQYYCEEDKTWHQPITEISQVPLSFRVTNDLSDGKSDKSDLKKVSDGIFKITSEQAQAEQYRIANTNSAWNKLMWLFTIVFGSIVIVAGMMFLRG